MDWQSLIESRPGVLGGKPVLKGTRISVELVLERFAAGATEEDLLKSYPHITREQIRAAFAYAAAGFESDRTIIIGSHR